MEAVGNALLHWDPVEHRDPDVRLYHEYPLLRRGRRFKKLQLDGGFAGDKWLLDQTARAARTGEAGDLHLTSEEVTLLREKAKSPSEAWQEIMRRRSEALARGGLAAVPPYGADKSISPGLGISRPALARAQGGPAFPGDHPSAAACRRAANQRANRSAIGKRRTCATTPLCSSVFSRRRNRADSWQLVDCVYYPVRYLLHGARSFPALAGRGRDAGLAGRFCFRAFPHLSRRSRSSHRGQTNDRTKRSARSRSSAPSREAALSESIPGCA